MNDQQRFGLKVLLAITLPVWIFPLAIAGCLFMACAAAWEAASELVDGSRHDPEDDGP